MSDHDNNTDDQSLSDLYADIGAEQPSAELDRRILFEARKAVDEDKGEKGASDKARGPFSGQWTVPVSLAAVIVLSVVVVMTIQRQQPETLSSLPQPDVSTSQSQPLAERQTADSDVVEPSTPAQKSTLAAKPAPKLAAKAREPKKASAATREEQRVAGFGQEARMQRRPAPLARNALPGSAASEPRRSEATGTSEETESLADRSVQFARSTEGSVAPKDEEAAVAGKVLADETAGEVAAESPATEAESAVPATVPSQEYEADREDRAAQTLAEEETAPTERKKAFKPGAGEPQTRRPAFFTLAAPREPGAKTDCSRLSEAGCIQSPDCTLQQEPESLAYHCRAADNICEQGFAQVNANRQLCERNNGCIFVPADCYCAPEAECECDGGSPAMCKPAIGSNDD
jgi:hypothetical protein